MSLRNKRKQIRLKDYDYSQEGAYFVTICLNQKKCLFGSVDDGKFLLNDAGEMVLSWWQKLSEKFDLVKTDSFIIMPNHIHGIILIVGAIPCDRPTLGDTLKWFKTMTTNEYIRGVKEKGWIPFDEKLWQRSYYEHIIRSEEELSRVREYIAQNPLKWELDRENPQGRDHKPAEEWMV